MAETYVKIAASPAYVQANGVHFDEKCRVVGVPKFAADDQACARLWEVSAEMTGLADN
jgi:hypothetical protein